MSDTDYDSLSDEKEVKVNVNVPNWCVSYESVVIPLSSEKAIEKILAMNTKGEYLIKYKNKSHWHDEWLSAQAVEELAKQKFKRYKNNLTSDSVEEIIDSNWLKIDKIIDDGEVNGELYYLCKWVNLSYDESTWESYQDIAANDELEKLEIFQEKRKVPEFKLERSSKENPFQPLKKSPVYLNENKLRSYQLEGVNWLLHCYFSGQSCIMADEMGLGKTVQSTTFLHELFFTYNKRGPFLIVAPLSTIPHWERELNGWSTMNAIVFHGNATSRNLIVDTEFYYLDSDHQILNEKHLYKFDVLVTTYEQIIAAPHIFKKIPFVVSIFDEAHKLKNSKAKIQDTLKSFTLGHKVLLTGTPLQNSLEELWALLHFLDPIEFPSDKEFLATYSLKTGNDVDRLQKLLKKLMLRRMKDDVEKEIPVKEETIVQVELTKLQRQWYKAILERNFSWLKKGSSNKNMPNLVNIMVELRKCCIHPFLLTGAEERIMQEENVHTMDGQYQLLIQSSGKMVLLDKLLTRLKVDGHKVLIFSQMTRCLDLLSDYLRFKGWLHERIDGGIRGNERQAAIDRFSAPDSDRFVFLLCTRAGGVGINLTSADTVVIFDSDFNPQNDLQAIARCHRIGQKKAVKIYRLVTRNTYEMEMLERASLKLGMDKAVFQRIDTQNLDGEIVATTNNSLSKEDVEELLKKGAYGAMDDEEAQNFCEEDIDQILERRSTVVTHEGKEQGSIFSKASFTIKETEVDTSDPHFWDNWANKANFDAIELDETDELIMNEPRSRKKLMDLDEEMSDVLPEDDDEEYGKGRKWSVAERVRLERKIMVYGFGRWDELKSFLSRRSEEELRIATRQLTKLCFEFESEEKLRLGLKAVLEKLDPDGVEYVFGDGSTLPIEPQGTFLVDLPQDYKDALAKKAKNLLLRMNCMFVLRHVILPESLEEIRLMEIPPPSGHLPAPWWNEEDDKDFLYGIDHYGYGQYDAIRRDPDLSFAKLKYHDENGKLLDIDANVTVTEGVKIVEQMQVDSLPWPSKSDMGIRLRKLIQAFQRTRAPPSKRVPNPLNRNQCVFNKKERFNFERTIMSYGVERDAENPDRIEWTRFAELAGIEKPIHLFDHYFKEFYQKNQEILSDEKVELDRQDSLNMERARRLFSRIEMFDNIRMRVLPHSKLDILLNNAKKTPGLPTWWDAGPHDKALLQAIVKHGLYRAHLITSDEELPFAAIKTELEAKDQKFEWLKEAVLLRRVGNLADLVVQPRTPGDLFAFQRKAGVGTATAGTAGSAASSYSVEQSGFKLRFTLNKSDDSGEETDVLLDKARRRLDDNWWQEVEWPVKRKRVD